MASFTSMSWEEYMGVDDCDPTRFSSMSWEEYMGIDNYYLTRAKTYSDLALKAFKEYNSANGRLRELIALGADSVFITAAFAMVNNCLEKYHYYEELCSSFAIKAQHCC